jgi:hypothetical protein
MIRPFELGAILTLFRLTSEKPVVRTHLPTKFVQLDGIIKTLI